MIGSVTFVETKLFTKLVQEYLSDDERIRRVAAVPHREPRSGGLDSRFGRRSQLRWGVAGRGKRGGLRVIYFLRLRNDEVSMLTLYAKNVADNIPAKVLKKIKEEIDAEG